MNTQNKPLYKQIYVDLKKKIANKEIVSGERLPTESQLAKQYDVSVITIKSALDLLVAEDILVRFPGKGSFIKESKTTKHIGILMNGLSISYGTEFVSALEKKLSSDGHTFTLLFSNEDPQLEITHLKKLKEIGVDGIIIFPVQNRYHNSFLIELILSEFPIVIIDRKLEGIESLFVGANNYEISKEMTQQLIDSGHKKISIVSHQNAHNATIQSRIDGIQDALIDNNILPSSPPINFLESEFIYTGKFSKDQTYILEDIKKTAEFLTENPDITCFFCLNYFGAEILFSAIESINKQVPRDYSLICFDIPNSLMLQSFFTHIQQNEEELAKNAANLLIKKIDGETIQQKEILVNSEIVLSKSTKNI